MVPGWFQFHVEPQVPFADSIIINQAIIVGRMPYAGVWPLGCSQIQQNSFIFTSDNSEMLIIWHLGKVVQRPEVLLFGRKSSISETDRSQDYIQKASKSVCTSTVMVVSWHPFFYSNFFIYEDSIKHRGWSWWPWTRYPVGILLLLLAQTKYRSTKKNYL